MREKEREEGERKMWRLDGEREERKRRGEKMGD